MEQEEQLEIPLKEASTAIRKLFQDTGMSGNMGRLVPRIGREQTDNELIFYVGFGRSNNEYADLVLKIYKGFNLASDEKKADVFCGMVVGARQFKPNGISKKIDIVDVDLKIVDQSYVQVKFSVDESLVEFSRFDLNQFADDIHAGIDEYAQIFEIFVEGLMRTAKISDNSKMFSYYASVAETLSYKKVEQMTDSLHEMVNYLMFELRSINPEAATTKSVYTPRDIVEGGLDLAGFDIGSLVPDLDSPADLFASVLGFDEDGAPGWAQMNDEFFNSMYNT